MQCLKVGISGLHKLILIGRVDLKLSSCKTRLIFVAEIKKNIPFQNKTPRKHLELLEQKKLKPNIVTQLKHRKP